MSCRHGLALGTCSRCYPETRRIDPGTEDALEGPGAVPLSPSPSSERLVPDVYDLATLLWSAWDGGIALSDGSQEVAPVLTLRSASSRPPTVAQDNPDLWRRMAMACLRAARGRETCPCCGRGGEADVRVNLARRIP